MVFLVVRNRPFAGSVFVRTGKVQTQEFGWMKKRFETERCGVLYVVFECSPGQLLAPAVTALRLDSVLALCIELECRSNIP